MGDDYSNPAFWKRALDGALQSLARGARVVALGVGTKQRRQSSDDDDLPLVPYVPFRCPSCSRMKPRTYSIRGRTRFHQCLACGTGYRSLELSSDHVRDWREDGEVLP